MRRILTLLAFVGSLSFAIGEKAEGSSNVSLAWNPSPSQNVAGYEVYYGTSSGNYYTAVPVSTVTNVTIRGLTTGTTYYFAAVSYNSAGTESAYSPEVSGVAGATNSSTTSTNTGTSTNTSGGTGTNAAALLTPLASTSKNAAQFGFSVAGQAGTYIVQGSTDLVHWVTLQTNVSPFNFVDSNANQFPRRFYRTGYLHN